MGIISLHTTRFRALKSGKLVEDDVVLEVEVPDEVKAAMFEMDEEQRSRDREQRRHEKTFTDKRIEPEFIRDRESRGQPPRLEMTLGVGQIWGGPDSMWVDGKCKFCGHIETLSPEAICLNHDCLRSGIDDVTVYEQARPTPGCWGRDEEERREGVYPDEPPYQEIMKKRGRGRPRTLPFKPAATPLHRKYGSWVDG